LLIGGVAYAQKKPDKKPAPAGSPASSAKPTPPGGHPASSAADDTPTLEIDQPTDNNPQPTTVPTLDLTPTPEGAATKDKELTLAEKHVSWQDIVVVMRKPFLKQNRFELIPAMGLTLNDNMIRHVEFNGRANYWFSDALAVGVEGQLFAHDLLSPFDLVARDYRRLPTLNQYNWGAALDFHYVPIYAKFAMFNKTIVHWELMTTLGVGVTQTQIIPRDPALQSWTNMNITPNVGLTARVFMASFLTLDIGVNDYIFVDKFENVNRQPTDSLMKSKDEASSQLINHIVFTAGVSFWFPMTFHYTTFR
jgi:outer membrane beta-barrel protein